MFHGMPLETMDLKSPRSLDGVSCSGLSSGGPAGVREGDLDGSGVVEDDVERDSEACPEEFLDTKDRVWPCSRRRHQPAKGTSPNGGSTWSGRGRRTKARSENLCWERLRARRHRHASLGNGGWSAVVRWRNLVKTGGYIYYMCWRECWRSISRSHEGRRRPFQWGSLRAARTSPRPRTRRWDEG